MTADREAQSFIGVEIPDDPEDEVIMTIPWVEALMPALEVIGKGLEKYKNPYTARQQLNFMGQERIDEIALYLVWWKDYREPQARMPTPRQWFAAGYLWRSTLIAESVREVKDPLVKNRLERMRNYIADGNGRWADIHAQTEKEADALMITWDLAKAENSTSKPVVDPPALVTAEPKQVQPIQPLKKPVLKPKRPVSATPRPVIRAKRKKSAGWKRPEMVNGRYPIMGTKLTYLTLGEWIACVEKLRAYAEKKELSEKRKNEFLEKAVKSLSPTVIRAEADLEVLYEGIQGLEVLRPLQPAVVGMLVNICRIAETEVKNAMIRKASENVEAPVVVKRPVERLVFGQPSPT